MTIGFWNDFMIKIDCYDLLCLCLVLFVSCDCILFFILILSFAPESTGSHGSHMFRDVNQDMGTRV